MKNMVLPAFLRSASEEGTGCLRKTGVNKGYLNQFKSTSLPSPCIIKRFLLQLYYFCDTVCLKQVFSFCI